MTRAPNMPVSYEDALALVSRDDRFRATVYAMNTLLIHKGVYSGDEFERLFVEWVAKEVRKSEARTGESESAGAG
jgi:hypothetical protein